MVLFLSTMGSFTVVCSDFVILIVPVGGELLVIAVGSEVLYLLSFVNRISVSRRFLKRPRYFSTLRSRKRKV